MASLFSTFRLVAARDLAPNGKPSQAEIIHVSVNHTGSRTINTRTDRTIRIWRSNHATLADPVVVESPHRGPVTCVSWNPNTEMSFASVGGDSTVKLWRGSGQLEREIKAAGGADRAFHLVAYSPDGRYLAVADTGATVRLHDVSAGYVVVAEVATGLAVNALVWPNKGHGVMVTAHADGHVKVWAVADGAVGPGRVLAKHHAPVTCLCMDPRGRYLGYGLSEGVVSLWRTADMTSHGVLAAVDRDISTVCPSRDGAYVAVGYGDGSNVRVYAWDTLEEVYEAPGTAGGGRGARAVWFPNRSALVVTSDRGQVMLLAKRD